MRFKLGCTWGINWVALEDAHGGTLVRAQECTKDSIERWTNGGPDAVLEGGLDGGLAVGFEWVSWSSLWKKLKM